MIDYWSDLNKKLFKDTDNGRAADALDLQIQAIKKSINNNFNIKLGELPGEPEFGSRVHEYLFSQLDIGTRILFEEDMKNVLRRWEPRIRVTSIDLIMNPDYNEIICNVKFIIVSDPEEREFEHKLSFETNWKS